MSAALILAVWLITVTSCAPPRAAREQVMSQTFSEDGSGLFKVNGRPISWGARVERIPFAFDPDFPADLRAGCVDAVKTLNQAVDRELIWLSDGDLRFDERPDGRNVISFGKSNRSFPVNHAAETVIHIARVNPRIVEADIDFDTRQFKFTLDARPHEADVESTCLHEIGHALGLTHVLERHSMMHPQLTLGVPRRKPSVTDVERLLILYPPPAR